MIDLTLYLLILCNVMMFKSTTSYVLTVFNRKGIKGTNKHFSSLSNREFEKCYWDKSISHVIGVDESGRGSLAGPVVSAAVCSTLDSLHIQEVNDSKQLSSKIRNEIYSKVQSNSNFIYSVSEIDHKIIDDINILQATMLSMSNCVNKTYELIKLKTNCNDNEIYCIIDGNKCPNKLPIKSKPLVKGDTLCYSIALASIIAKVTRDNLMIEYDKMWPQYSFAKNKGYPSKDHILAIHKYGPCPIHRLTYKPLKGRNITILQPTNSPQ